MKRQTTLSAVIVLLGLACSDKLDEREALEAAAPAATSDKEATQSPADRVTIQERKIIKEGTLRFETDDMDKTRAKINRAVARYEGFVVNDFTSNSEDEFSQTMVIRVPADHFDVLVSSISEGVTEFVVRNIRATDVTEEYVDIEARLKVKREIEARYTALLAQAATVEEILAIEKQAGEVRTEIESIEGRLRYLRNRVALSTLTVTYFVPVAPTMNISSKFTTALSEGWHGFINLLVGLTYLWPFVLFGWLVFAVVRVIVRVRRRRRNKGASGQKGPPNTVTPPAD